ncbi:MAG TPA: DUF1549 and DUF1553 domain-containing protein [Verrucomicrobiales bacterium]|nr:DUF1549 and DUF1553 domain-containing protein [Verrucomicrobiales bacterium]
MTGSPRHTGSRNLARFVLAASLFVGPAEMRAETASPDGSSSGAIDWEAAREFWAFQSPRETPPPSSHNREGAGNLVDAFIQAALQAADLPRAPEASPYTLIRRATYDLTGLPPSATEVEAFLSDSRPDAWERLVDRLLASPEFGERLASMWLNAARYAEDQAHQVGNDTKFFYPNAWRYRSWVIAAFNRDLPYDRFIRSQLAADLLPNEIEKEEHLPALGFLGLGPQYYNRGRLEVMAEEWEDRVDTVTRSFLALTVACARCHDHKYDPLSTEDYHALAGVFASTNMLSGLHPAPQGEPSEEEAKQLRLHIVEEGKIQDLPVFLRGDVERKGSPVARRFLRVLSPGEPRPFTQGSGRLELAEAIADPKNPLTARVMVNRLWHIAFGAPLVATPSNFGALGERPSHPELLDQLALRFIRADWSIKDLLRTMMLSEVYRQSADGTPETLAADPSNRLWSRMPRRRMTVEMWRDSLLAISGELSREDGPSMELSDPNNLRRTIHGRVSRLELNQMLLQFDYPDPNVHAEQRVSTTTPLQKLFLLNNPFVLDRCETIASAVLRDVSPSASDRIDALHRRIFGRNPESWERETGLAWLNLHGETRLDRWTAYVHVLVTSNAFHYRD